MATTPGQTIGRTLARLGLVGTKQAQPNRTPDSRSTIETLIVEAPEPMSIEAISQATGLHANTVRAHLEVLEAGGRIERLQGKRAGRGRPPWLYRATAADPSPHLVLAEALLDQLQDSDSADITTTAAARWAATLHGERTEALPAAETPDDAVADVVAALDDLGFTATADALGDRIDLQRCPYAEFVAERPVICDIHAALITQLLDTSGQPVTLQRLDVWSRSGHCTAYLSRPDINPAWTVPASPGPTD